MAQPGVPTVAPLPGAFECGRAKGVAALGVLVATVLVTGCAGPSEDPLATAAAEVRTGEPIPYEVEVAGVDEALTAQLRAVSESVATSDEPPTSLLALRRRAVNDTERLTAALGGEGYYDATVDSATEPAGEETPASIRFAITPGERYRFAAIVVDLVGDVDGYSTPDLATLGLRRDDPAVAQAVFDAEAALLEDARARGHAYAAAVSRQAVIDTAAKTLDVTIQFSPGPVVALGDIDVSGIDGIDRAYVDRQIQWTPGDVYTPEALTETRRALVATGLFQVVDVTLPETPPADGTAAPVTIRAQQRKHRTISGGVRFETDAGPGADVTWEHRNILGAGETFRARADVDLLEQVLELRFRKPQFTDPDRALLAESNLRREDTDAFESLAIDASVGIEETFSETLDGTLALAAEYSDITDNNGNETFGLLFVPATLRYDGTDDTLNASRGVRARVEAVPFWDMLDTTLTFQRLRLDASTYFKTSDAPRTVLAIRGALGAMVGADRDAIPATKRFYAGGGGSVRGIPFQLASPLDEDGNPLGGRSLLELSGEFRYDISETVGVVGFVDAGSSFEASFPDFDEPLIVGAGVGLRYYTEIGPLRVDVAVPVDQREVDDPFQFYISLGQAF